MCGNYRETRNFKVGFVRIRSVFSDSFGFVPTCRILWGPGFMRFFCPQAGATPAVLDDLRFLILLRHCFFQYAKIIGIRELYIGCDDLVLLFDWSRVANCAFFTVAGGRGTIWGV